MEENLNNMFAAIISSENKAYEKLQKHKELLQSSKATRDQLKKEEELAGQLQKKIEELEASFVTVDIQLREKQLYKEYLGDRLESVSQDSACQQRILQEVEEQYVSEALSLMKEVGAFSKSCGLRPQARDRRMACAREELKELDFASESAEKEKREAEIRKQAIVEAMDARNKLLHLKESLNVQIADTKSTIKEETSAMTKLETESERLQDEPESGEEFLLYNQELERYSIEGLQAQAEEIHAELTTVMDELRKKEEQSLKRQFNHWSRYRQNRSGISLGATSAVHEQPRDQSVPSSDQLQQKRSAQVITVEDSLGHEGQSPCEMEQSAADVVFVAGCDVHGSVLESVQEEKATMEETWTSSPDIMADDERDVPLA